MPETVRDLAWLHLNNGPRGRQVVEFEYHGVGAWKTGEKLADVISTMRSYGYVCFWQSNRGQLSPFIHECTALYEFRRWSNVVCATGDKIVTALSTLVPTDLQAHVLHRGVGSNRVQQVNRSSGTRRAAPHRDRTPGQMARFGYLGDFSRQDSLTRPISRSVP